MFKSSLFVTVITVAGSILGLLVQFIIARSYGVGSIVDSYFFSLSWPLLFSGMMSSALSFMLIPRIGDLLVKEPTDVRGYVWTRFFALLILLLGFTPIATFLTWTQLEQIGSASVFQVTRELIMLCVCAWVAAFLLVIKNFFVAVLHGLRVHVLSATLSLFPYVSMVCFLEFMPLSVLGIKLPVLAMIFGLVAAILTGAYVFFRRHGFFYDLLSSRKAAVELASSLPTAGLALSCFSAYSIIDAYIAPRFGEGSLTIISLIQRVIIGIGNLVVSGISAVLIHNFISKIHERDYAGFTRSLITCSLSVFVAAFAIFSPLYMYSVDTLYIELDLNLGQELEFSSAQAYFVEMIPGACAMLTSVILMRVLFCFDQGRFLGIAMGILWVSLYTFGALTQIDLGLSALTSSYTNSWLIVVVVLVATVLLVGKVNMSGVRSEVNEEG